MMREIKFRGKRTSNGEWATGDLLTHGASFRVIHKNGIHLRVEDETIGQYTGLKDSKGNEIYEGDIIKFSYKPLYPLSDSEFDEVVICRVAVCLTGEFILEKSRSDEFEESLFRAVNYDSDLEVIGNIHENPELLEGEDVYKEEEK